jgi:hypothetical protein
LAIAHEKQSIHHLSSGTLDEYAPITKKAESLLEEINALSPVINASEFKNINSSVALHNNNGFFSPSAFASRQAPYGPYRDYYCSSADPAVIEGLKKSLAYKR